MGGAEKKPEEDSSSGSGGNKSFMSQVKDLLSKLKPGDDLTHTSLPATFMAPRSMCELIAEATLPRLYTLALASSMPSPEDRMLGVVRNFVFNFFANKAGNKPFNPVLGERYDAYVRFESTKSLGLKRIRPEDSDSGSDKALAASASPATSHSRDQDTRLKHAKQRLREDFNGDKEAVERFMKGSAHLRVEQTSHHPPVTTSYLSHPQSGVSIERSAGVEVTFHGTYVKVLNVGTCSLRFDRPGLPARDVDSASSGEEENDADGDANENPGGEEGDSQADGKAETDSNDGEKGDAGSGEAKGKKKNRRKKSAAGGHKRAQRDKGDEEDVTPEHYVITRSPEIHFRIFRMASEYVGKTTIFCPETGCGASIQFKEKPTVGGRWNDMHATVWRVTGAQPAKARKSKSKKMPSPPPTMEPVTETLYEITGNWLDGMVPKLVKKDVKSAKGKGKKETDEDASPSLGLGTAPAWTKSNYPGLLFEEDTGDADEADGHMNTFQIWGEAMNAIARGDMDLANKSKNRVELEQRRIRAEREKSGEDYDMVSFEQKPSGFLDHVTPNLLDSCDGDITKAVDCLAWIDPELPVALRAEVMCPTPHVVPKKHIPEEARRIRTLFSEVVKDKRQ